MEVVKAMNDSVKDKTRRDGKISSNRPARPARDSFRTSFAGGEHCLHQSLADLAPDAKASLSKCVSEHFQSVSYSAKNMAHPTGTLLAVVKAG